MANGDGLRDLARQIEELLVKHFEVSRAGRVVHNCIDHLTLMAKLSDYENKKEDE